jgi:hypothetical protein
MVDSVVFVVTVDYSAGLFKKNIFSSSMAAGQFTFYGL